MIKYCLNWNNYGVGIDSISGKKKKKTEDGSVKKVQIPSEPKNMEFREIAIVLFFASEFKKKCAI